jgi:peptidoglycan L-alanyl-D-glutamate endopeptidase CwlK
MTFTLSQESLEKLTGVKPELINVVKRALEISSIDFKVLEGLRTLERQVMLVKSGKSQTMNSRHITGDAVDLGAIINGVIDWNWKYYEQIAHAMKQAGKELNITIEWGGDWKTFKDGVHFQLPYKKE